VIEGKRILSNGHVVTYASQVQIQANEAGDKISATVEAIAPGMDMAILKLDDESFFASHAPLPRASALPQIKDAVMAYGYPEGGTSLSITKGIVSRIEFTAYGSFVGGLRIQIDAAINPGNSGGPLLNMLGQVVGINTAVDMQGQLVGFAIPSNDAKKDLDSFKRSGKITRPFLGVRYIMLNHALAEAQKLPRDFGALIVRGETATDFAVLPGSPADKAGIVENDIILEINGTKLDGENTLARLLKPFNTGDEVTLKVYHKGDEKTIKVKLEDAK